MQINYNPDVLSCIANLSNDEVFTPPTIVNKMLDMLPSELWSDSRATFLDPVSKTGVFLREIAKRLMIGLEKEIPDPQERTNHILTKQLYGIAITELTSLLSRRSLYCSKRANGEYSVCTEFDDEQGNILFRSTPHTWERGRCKFCGASQEVYERENLESHAYQFIHTNTPETIFENMRFDVIIGNPPYQMNDGGGMGTSAIPLYHRFVEQAIKLNPRFLSMIIPSRWFSGGKGLDEFRGNMLSDRRLRKLTDYFNSSDCFSGIDLSGGVCYFLWDRDNIGDCEITTVRSGNKSTLTRPLIEQNANSFIRFNEAISILKKVNAYQNRSFESAVSARKPFGGISGISGSNSQGSVKVYAYPKDGYISKDKVLGNIDWVDKYKVYISKAYGERGEFPYLVLGKPFLGEPNTCCTETYLVLGVYNNEAEANNVIGIGV